MIKRFLIVLIIFVSLIKYAGAWSYGEFVDCNGITPNPQVEISVSYGQLIYDFSKNKDQLSSEAKSSVSGYAVSSYGYSILFDKARLKRLDKKHSCLLLDEIRITVYQKNPEIYVANDYEQKSCSFSNILRHEQVHQRINVLTFEYILPIINVELRKAISNIRAVKVNSGDSSDAQRGFRDLRDHYLAVLTPILNEMEIIRKMEHTKLDNEVSYNEQWQVCRDYEKRLAVKNEILGISN